MYYVSVIYQITDFFYYKKLH